MSSLRVACAWLSWRRAKGLSLPWTRWHSAWMLLVHSQTFHAWGTFADVSKVGSSSFSSFMGTSWSLKWLGRGSYCLADLCNCSLVFALRSVRNALKASPSFASCMVIRIMCRFNFFWAPSIHWISVPRWRLPFQFLELSVLAHPTPCCTHDTWSCDSHSSATFH